jgi:RNA-directed DNA polymerase
MKRAGNLIERIADPDNLRLAAWKAAKGKRHSREVLAYHADLDEHLVCLRHQLLTGRVETGDYRYFRIYEPKERLICASAFREQVLHHALMNVCHIHFDDYLIEDSYASRQGKGVHAALDRAQYFTARYGWYLKLDVKKFFDSIHHDTLKKQLSRRFKDDRVLSAFFQIIDSYEAVPGRGVPIGNLTSQYFANHYLAGLDRFVKQELGCKAYVRYMDDMVLWHAAKEWLRQANAAIDQYVTERLHCRLKPVQLNRTGSGVPFLGYRLFSFHRRLLHKSKIRFIRKLRKATAEWEAGHLHEKQYQQRIQPLLAFLGHANVFYFKKSILHLIGQ